MQDHLFAKLPIALIKCGLYAELQPTSIVVYNVLLSYANFKTGVCFPSITTISTLSGLDRKTVIQAIKELEDWGLIQVSRRKGSHNVYQLQYWWGPEETSTKFSTSGVENFHQSIRRLFQKELPAEIIDEKFAQGIKAQFLLEIMKNISDPEKIRNPIGWFTGSNQIGVILHSKRD